ncbi:MAG: hypothetical protein WA982_17000 [Rubrobacteraceae bacterium]
MARNGVEKPHEQFEAKTAYEWSPETRRGFDDAYGERGFNPPGDGEITEEREEYEQGFEHGGYTLLEENYPGVSEATSDMHLATHSSIEDTINWLLVPVDKKYGSDFSEELAAYLSEMREKRKTVYG